MTVKKKCFVESKGVDGKVLMFVMDEPRDTWAVALKYYYDTLGVNGDGPVVEPYKAGIIDLASGEAIKIDLKDLNLTGPDEFNRTMEFLKDTLKGRRHLLPRGDKNAPISR